jgi:hypothetical protein
MLAGGRQAVMAAAMATGLQPMYAVVAMLCLLAVVATIWLPVRLVRPPVQAGAPATGGPVSAPGAAAQA